MDFSFLIVTTTHIGLINTAPSSKAAWKKGEPDFDRFALFFVFLVIGPSQPKFQSAIPPHAEQGRDVEIMLSFCVQESLNGRRAIPFLVVAALNDRQIELVHCVHGAPRQMDQMVLLDFIRLGSSTYPRLRQAHAPSSRSLRAPRPRPSVVSIGIPKTTKRPCGSRELRLVHHGTSDRHEQPLEIN